MSKRYYDSLQETLSVLSNQYLIEKIRHGDEQYENQQFTEHELIEISDDWTFFFDTQNNSC